MTTFTGRRRKRRAEAVGAAIGLTLVHLAFDFAYALILAIPVMLLTANLNEWGWTFIVPLSYWQSWWAAFLLAWIVDGSGTIRRLVEDK
jgi:hypothetical protein